MAEVTSVEREFSTAESLRALRRGLRRSSGQFGLFIAVTDRMELRDEMIRRLVESMPDVEIETVQLDSWVVDPLAEVIDQLPSSGDGAVMVCGLERAVKMGSDDAPVLRAMNLEREEWRRRLRRPVVFWISKEVLSAFGRTAPDFLDWRSDTFDLTLGSDREVHELIPLDSGLWRGGIDNRMPGTARRARIDELRSRIQALPASDDPEIERRRTAWLFELGNHLLFVGDLEAATAAYRSAASYLEAEKDLENLARVQYQLGTVAHVQGDVNQARRLTENAKAVFQLSEDAVGLGRCLQQIGRILIGQGKFGEAAQVIEEALRLAEEAPDILLVASLQSDLGLLLILTDQPQEAASLIEEALARFVEIGDRGGVGSAYYQLGLVQERLGKLGKALEWYEKSLALSQEIGHLELVAIATSQIGVLALEQGHVDEAVQRHVASYAIRGRLGIRDSNTAIDVSSLLRERELLGDRRFTEIVRAYAESPAVADAILEATDGSSDLERSAREIAEPAAVYGTENRSSQGD